jgi:hypothetical protein
MADYEIAIADRHGGALDLPLEAQALGLLR